MTGDKGKGKNAAMLTPVPMTICWESVDLLTKSNRKNDSKLLVLLLNYLRGQAT